MVHLFDIAPEGMWDTPFIISRVNEEGTLRIFNYTKAAQWTPNAFDNPAVRAARGLIVREDTFEVVARPLPKFFNHNQDEAPEIAPDSLVEVSDKIDGSLGILYREPSTGELRIATRGSFTSEMAVRGTAMLPDDFEPWEGYTYLFEIIYPENRIVVDYGDDEKLVLLRVLDKDGNSYPPAEVAWTGEVAKSFGYMPYKDALALPPRENAEGVVVRELHTQNYVKVKQPDYLELHKIATNFSFKQVFTARRDGVGWEYFESLPDEFRAEAEMYYDTIGQWVVWLIDYVEDVFWQHNHLTDRREFAQAVSKYPIRDLLFKKLDKTLNYTVLYKYVEKETNLNNFAWSTRRWEDLRSQWTRESNSESGLDSEGDVQPLAV